MQKLVSIIVPVYCIEQYIRKCIESLINQTYKNIEIILIDDGSTDSSGMICEDYQKNDKRIKVYHKKNGGLSDARNYGIKKSKGEYLVFVDGDDYVDSHMIEKLVKTIEKDESEIGVCSRLEVFEDGKTTQTYKSKQEHIKMNFSEALKELCSFNIFDMSAWAKIYKRELFSDLGFPVGKLSEDYFIMYKLFEKASAISYINNPLYFYTQRSGSISKNKKINYDYKQAAYEQMDYIENKYPELKKYVRTAYLLSNMTIFDWYLKNRGELPSKKEYKTLKKEVKNNIQYILENEKISKSRKIQARIFITNRFLYGGTFKLYKLLKG